MSSTNATRSSRIGPPRLHMPLQVQRQLFPQEEAVRSQPGLRVQPKPEERDQVERQTNHGTTHGRNTSRHADQDATNGAELDVTVPARS